MNKEAHRIIAILVPVQLTKVCAKCAGIVKYAVLYMRSVRTLGAQCFVIEGQ